MFLRRRVPYHPSNSVFLLVMRSRSILLENTEALFMTIIHSPSHSHIPQWSSLGLSRQPAGNIPSKSGGFWIARSLVCDCCSIRATVIALTSTWLSWVPYTLKNTHTPWQVLNNESDSVCLFNPYGSLAWLKSTQATPCAIKSKSLRQPCVKSSKYEFREGSNNGSGEQQYTQLVQGATMS